MAAKWIELVTGSLEQKKQYRQFKARLDALPEPYGAAAKALFRYFMYNGGTPEDGAAITMMNDFIVGNVRERPIRDIYHDDQLGKLRGIEKDECSACAAYMTCRGGCRIRSQAAGDFFAKDPLCPKDAGQDRTYSARQSSPFQYLGLPHAL